MKYRILSDKRNLSYEDWLEVRRQGIGGSDAAAIAGLNPYCSPLSIWAQKRGIKTEEPDNEMMRQGRDLEAYVASRWEEATGKKTRRRAAVIQHPAIDFILGDIDRFVIGEDAGLECKTTSFLNATDYAKAPPPWYLVQCHHYMVITGVKKWYLAILALNKAFIMHEVQRDEEVIASLIKIESEFWDKVQKGIPPDPDGSDDYTEMLKEKYLRSQPMEIELTLGTDRIRRYEELRTQQSELETEIQSIEQAVQLEMGEAERAKCGPYRFTWKTQERTGLDTTALKKEMPQILAKYTKTTLSRPMRFKRISKAFAPLVPTLK